MGVVRDTEDAIITALQSALPGVPVRSFIKPPEYVLEDTYRGNTVLVGYVKGDFKPNRVMTGVVQPASFLFYVFFIAENLRETAEGAYSAYDLLETAREALAGLNTPGGAVEVEGEELYGTMDGKFAYLLAVRVNGEFRKIP